MPDHTRFLITNDMYREQKNHDSSPSVVELDRGSYFKNLYSDN